ncbi:MAG: hypothetical protein AYK19_03750 [Theionarchaea archaeon DG-70-1]|nr:MAG: hypothetical protein AYK19_03750 [Theionarchaea archaeon DG-70-1]
MGTNWILLEMVTSIKTMWEEEVEVYHLLLAILSVFCDDSPSNLIFCVSSLFESSFNTKRYTLFPRYFFGRSTLAPFTESLQRTNQLLRINVEYFPLTLDWSTSQRCC